MRNFLLLSLLLAGTSLTMAQTPAPPATGARATQPAPAAPAQPPPAAATPPAPAAPTQAQPAARGSQPASGARATQPASGARGATAAARSGLAVIVTDMRGATLPGIQVQLSGSTFRLTETNAGGQVNFTLLQAGTYRLRFSGDAVTTFEREVTIASGKTSMLDVSLNPAPPVREVVKEVRLPAAAPPPPAVGPLGDPQILSLYDMAEKELKTKQPRSEILIACSGNLRSTLVFLSKEQPQRLYDAAEASYYVLGGEATFRVGGDEKALGAGGYVAVPRGVPFTITRRGNKALSLLAMLSGAPCEEGR